MGKRKEAQEPGLDLLESWMEPWTPRRVPWIVRLAAFLLVPALIGAGIAVPTALVLANATAGGLRTMQDNLRVREPLVEPPLPGRSEVRDKDGNLMATLYTYDRTPVGIDRIAPVVLDAVVATEDARFYQHAGVDWQGLARALVSNYSGNPVQGGSSITQQYIKNARALNALLEGNLDAAVAATEQTPYRKLEEVRLALDIEKNISKQDILVRYLNIAYFGRGAYGIESAARRYFSKPASDLQVHEAALLAGLLQGPDLYNPTRSPEEAKERRNTVLRRMVQAGFLSEKRARSLSLRELGLNLSTVRQGCVDPVNGLYCDAVRRALLSEPLLGKTEAQRKAALLRGGLTIYTNLDPQVQSLAIEAAQASVPAEHRVAVGVAVVQPGTGKVLALASNRTYGIERGQTQLPLLTTRAFQPGSTFKPFTLAAALESGWDLDSTLPGGATYASEKFFNPEDGSYYNVEGYPGTDVTVMEATRSSLNTAYIQLAEQVGIPAVADVANRLGVQAPEALGDKDGTYILGSYEVSVLEMSAAYAALAADGLYCPPRLVQRVDGLANGFSYYPEPCEQAVTPSVARAVTAILGGVVKEGTATRAQIPGREVAGKTGTSASHGAAWFIGYTPQIAAAVWMGDPRGGPTHPMVNTLGLAQVYGGSIAPVIWRTLVAPLLDSMPAVALPKLSRSYLLDTKVVTGKAVVPNLVGLSAQDAASLLSNRLMKVRVEQDPDAPQRAVSGTVVGTTPVAGTVVRQGSVVTLQVAP